MHPDRWRRVEELYHSALDHEPEKRCTFLDEVCKGDDDLRRLLDDLLSQTTLTNKLVPPPVWEAVADSTEPMNSGAEEQRRAAAHLAGPPGHRSEFTGTERFVVQSRLGAGGFGVVYQVYDRQQDAAVALKVLPEAAAGALYYFKREFRALANTVHRNLVMLYELLSDNQQWFFTMELVDGVDFIRYVSHDNAAGPARPEQTYDLDRLRSALRQLAEGACALHQAGKLHRDLKPSNVLVNKDGRVMVLDFGLATEIAVDPLSENGLITGTPAYMSPEQAAGRPLSEASDWYSVGVMLYQALTGRMPLVAHTREVLALKQDADIPPPSTLVAGLPKDLDSLCCDLLRSDPAARPSGREVLEHLGGPESMAAGDAPSTFPTGSEAPFVGRESEIAELRRAFGIVQQGRAAVVYVDGASGTGKSALVGHFLQELRNDDAALVLAGRCYERESVPYKALDSLVDALTQHLLGLPASLSETVVPVGLAALTRLFPVLERVEPFARSSQGANHAPNLQELRQEAFRAFRELLSHLARFKPVVLFIDDLQWGDADSAALLGSLFRPPGPPPVLWIACFRNEEAETSPLLRTLLPSQSAWASEVHLIQVALKELTWLESRDLARDLLREEGAAALADAIAHEARCNPFFIHELARSLGENGPEEPGSLDNIIRRRVSRLPEGARVLLELVAVAGQPIALEVVKRAARIQGEDESVVGVLRARYLVRTRSTEDRIEIETYHDRTRQAVGEHLAPPVLKAHHGALGAELEACGRVDHETLAMHFQGAGETAKAARYAVSAAERASAALAFDRAARLYRTALDLGLDDPTGTPRLRQKLGDALTNAGRGGEAADAYLKAAEGMEGLERLEMERRAAAQLLLSGRIDEGLDVARGVLDAVGVRMARTKHRSLARFFLWRARIGLRGLSFHERDAAQIPAEERIRIDTCFSVMQALTMVDTFWAHEFHSRSLLYSLRSGDIYRIARALVAEAGVYAARGAHYRRRAQELLDTATKLAERSNNLHAMSLAALESGVFAFLRGEWTECRRRMDQAETTLRRHCTGVGWEIATSRMMATVCLFFMGELKLLNERLPMLLQDAEERGDIYEGTDFRNRLAHVAPLVADRPDRAYEEIDMALKRWPRHNYRLHHWWTLTARLETDFYCGRGRAAWEEVSRQWEPFRRTIATRIQYVKMLSRHHRACAALACTEDHGVPISEHRRLIRTAERDAAIIEREKMPWGMGLALLVRAGVAARRGKGMEAESLLTVAEGILESADMPLYAAAARRRRGELIAGEVGRALIAEADTLMLRQEIRNPARMAAMLAPGISLT